MEKIRYIDLLLTLRSEYLKLKDNFDGILDDIEVRKPFRNEGVSLSKEKKFKSIIDINLNIPRLQLLIEKDTKSKDSTIYSRYDIIERTDCDSTVPMYGLDRVSHSLDFVGPNIIDTFGSCNITPIEDSDFYKLSEGKQIKKSYSLKDNMYIDLSITFGFPVFSYDERILHGFSRKRITYNFQENLLEYNTKRGFGLPLSDGSIADSGDPQEGFYHISTVLNKEVDLSIIPDDWREFFEKHLIVCDKTILIDDLDYDREHEHLKKASTEVKELCKTRLLELKEKEMGISRYKIRL